MEVKLIDSMGSDLSVVNAARVSFNKVSSEVGANGIRLIKYLAKHQHNTPFMHNSVTLHMKVPLFVARQIHKHQVGFTVNEVSRRYITDEPEFYVPDVWRKAADNVKQGSSDEAIDPDALPSSGRNPDWYANKAALGSYKGLLALGVCPEQARMVLPQSMYTEFYMTGSLYGWAQVYLQRSDSHAQKEVQVVAEQIGDLMRPLFPVSWEALT
jgi:thymidylate synthase (FAD)